MEPAGFDVRWTKGQLILSVPYDLFTTVSYVINAKVLEKIFMELDS